MDQESLSSNRSGSKATRLEDLGAPLRLDSFVAGAALREAHWRHLEAVTSQHPTHRPVPKKGL